MKKTLVVALALALVLALSAQPALAYRYLFTDVDTTDEIGLADLIANWYTAAQGGGLSEMDVGDMAAAPSQDSDQYGHIDSPTVPGGIPLRTYILNTENVLRTLNLFISNEAEDIVPPEAVTKLAGQDFNEVVKGFSDLMAIDTAHEDYLDQVAAFSAQYADQIDSAYEAFLTYMSGAGFDGMYTASKGEFAEVLYIATQYLPIGPALLDAMNDPNNPDRFTFLCAELYKGVLATFLEDEVSMETFKSIVYMWMTPDPDTQGVTGSPYAFLSFDEETQEWVLVDIMQILAVGDTVQSSEIWDVIIDLDYFTGENADSKIIALYYDADAGEWMLAGMNTACMRAFLEA